MSKLRYIKISDYKTDIGKTMTRISLSYQIFGMPLGTAPIVLVNHALTGNSTVTGEGGWWADFIGPNKCVDTNVYTVLAFNVPGNGFDGDDKNLIENYKDFTAKDIAQIFLLGLKQLQITSLFAVIGGSVGGGIAWEMAALQPTLTEHLIPIATDWKSTNWIMANCHIQDAILNHSSQPLADARMHAMTLYRTPESFASKFKRNCDEVGSIEVESWLNYHGEALTRRFHLAAYKLLNQILKTIDITKNKTDFDEVVSTITAHIHLVAINSDLFFKPQENWETYKALKQQKDNVYIHEINSIHGHDAFLIEYDQLINFLKPIFENQLSSQKSPVQNLASQTIESEIESENDAV